VDRSLSREGGLRIFFWRTQSRAEWRAGGSQISPATTNDRAKLIPMEILNVPSRSPVRSTGRGTRSSSSSRSGARCTSWPSSSWASTRTSTPPSPSPSCPPRSARKSLFSFHFEVAAWSPYGVYSRNSFSVQFFCRDSFSLFQKLSRQNPRHGGDALLPA